MKFTFVDVFLGPTHPGTTMIGFRYKHWDFGISSIEDIDGLKTELDKERFEMA